MSQSMTIYRISKSTFEKLEASGKTRKFKVSSAKSYTSFEGSFMGLEYVLSKGQEPKVIELLQEIFNPKTILGVEGFDALTPEEQYELYESGGLIPYLGTDRIAEIHKALDRITGKDIHAN